MGIFPEVAIAARWWTYQLLNMTPAESGDAFNDAFRDTIRGKFCRPVTPDKAADFEDALARLGHEVIDEDDGWDVTRPEWGAIHRTCCKVDYNASRVLTQAANEAGIANIDMRLPIKTVMWINPGSVKVAKGYRASVEEVYTCTPTAKADNESHPSTD